VIAKISQVLIWRFWRSLAFLLIFSDRQDFSGVGFSILAIAGLYDKVTFEPTESAS
jgi:hypothetical protein